MYGCMAVHTYRSSILNVEVEVGISATLTCAHVGVLDWLKQALFFFAMTISAGASFLLVPDKASLLKKVPDG